jgi:hypothetical protein
MTAGRITVDACEGGCGGIWFDRYELMRVDEADESAGEGLLEIERDPNVQVDLSKRLNCPKDPEVVMMRHFSSTNSPNAQHPKGPARAQPLRDRRRGAGGGSGAGVVFRGSLPARRSACKRCSRNFKR